MKAKIHSVTINNTIRMFVWAQTKQGAIRDALEELAKLADVSVATGEQLYAAGVAGTVIHGEEKYKRMVDPNQQELPGVTSTEPDTNEA